MLSLTLDGDWHPKLPKGGTRHYYVLNEAVYFSLTLSLHALATPSCRQHYGAGVTWILEVKHASPATLGFPSL